MLTKRMKVCITAGAVLGIVCIIGAQLRSGFGRDASYLFAFWYNRLLMGVVIGLAGGNLGLPKALGRGALLGFFVSFAFYSATGFDDVIGFLAGIVYGIIIEYVAVKYGQQ
ncbi:Hypothetical protein Tpal_2372 [Trichococcus palustris]|jgi:hypothetical protein|uniref:Uncharacterized protein n=1 Tax=Trichococcus palustris TaxID=140314 RepID=A0A143YUV7_9LACT|nr:hypothetical protein [Trichococcus palustris]CZQ99441.1 Hypothetical protein Tpal_2372 [Trichococcus palustris]SFK87651.1 hypothetical protein SAMN04488076_10767 [Trichococcus palustris]